MNSKTKTIIYDVYRYFETESAKSKHKVHPKLARQLKLLVIVSERYVAL